MLRATGHARMVIRRACARGWIFGQNASRPVRARAVRAKCSLAGLKNIKCWPKRTTRSPAPGLQNKSYWRVCRHFAARVTITFYTASARFQLAARSVALC